MSIEQLHQYPKFFLNLKEQRVLFEVGNFKDLGIVSESIFEEQLNQNILDNHADYKKDITDSLKELAILESNKRKKTLIEEIGVNITEELGRNKISESLNEKIIIKDKYEIEVSPNKFPYLKELFGDFEPFYQNVVVVKSKKKIIKQGRFISLQFFPGTTIVIGDAVMDIAFQNELTHALVDKIMPDISNSVDNIFKDFSGFPFKITPTNLQVNEFFSDIVSFQVDPKKMFNRTKKWANKDNLSQYLRFNNLKKKYEKLRNKRALLLLSGKSDTDEYQNIDHYLNDMNILYQIILQDEKLNIFNNNYNFTLRLFRYWQDENPKITPEEMAAKYMDLGKKLVKFYKEKKAKNIGTFDRNAILKARVE